MEPKYVQQMPCASPFCPAYISLGSNQGDSRAILKRAVEVFASQDASPSPLFRLGACSSLYVTEPQLYSEQPFFINQVVRLDCFPDCTALSLLRYLQSLERELGRVRTGPRYGPRAIDLDILLFGQQQISSDVLTIPHERMYERAFVLVPLAEIAPGLALPEGKTIDERLGSITYTVDGNLILQTSPQASAE